MKYLMLSLVLLSSSGCQDKFPVSLMKVYVNDCNMPNKGEMFTMAKVESMSLCLSIAKAYNQARVRNETSSEYPMGEFGMCAKDYAFQCIPK